MTTHKEIHAANKAKQREAAKAAGHSHCRMCGKVLPGEIESVFIIVPVDDGHASAEEWTPTGRFGYRGSRICSLRCGFRWANTHAEKAR